MSRGIGQLQRAIVGRLEALPANGGGYLTAPELAAAVFGDGFSRSDLVNVRRAVASLAGRGLVLSACLSLRPHWVRAVWLPSHPRSSALLRGVPNDSVSALAQQAHVSRATMARAERLQREEPERFAQVVHSVSIARATK